MREEQGNVIRIAQVIGSMCAAGVESVIFNYYKAIDKTKFQFDFYYHENSSVEPPKELIDMGARFYKLPKIKNIFKYLKVLKNYLSKNNYKIIHSNINTLNVFPLYVAKKCHIPVRICHNHSTAQKGEGLKTLAKYILRPLNKLYATHYFACGENAGRWMYGNKFFDKGKVTIINNAIDVEKFAYDEIARHELRKELGIPEDAFVVGHVGRFCYQKNHKFLIKIFKDLKKVRKNAILLLVGDGVLFNKIHKMVEKKGLQDSVIFTRNRTDVNKLYSAMDVLCLPSFYEGVPVVLVEAQANSLPCIYSEQITNEVMISDITKGYSLKSETWLNNLTHIWSRKQYSNIDFTKFNLNEQIHILEQFYTKFYLGCA